MSWDPAPNASEFQGGIGCGHYRAGKCQAYPERIPLAIVSGEVDHMVKRPGQAGDTVFEPMDFDLWRRTRRRIPMRAPAAAELRTGR